MISSFNLSGGSGGHLAAGLGTAATDFGTGTHLLVIFVNAQTVLSTAFAHHRAYTAGQPVKRRLAQHKIGAGMANLDTVQQQANMIRCDMSPAHVQAMV
jgi:hypothetical protein